MTLLSSEEPVLKQALDLAVAIRGNISVWFIVSTYRNKDA